MRGIVLVVVVVVVMVMAAALTACGDDHGPSIDAPSGDGLIRSCDDIDASGVTSETIDALVAMYEGRPCQAPLEGGISSLLQECQYGAYVFVCGQSAGLSQFGCNCWTGVLSCSNGEHIRDQQEMLCDAGVN